MHKSMIAKFGMVLGISIASIVMATSAYAAPSVHTGDSHTSTASVVNENAVNKVIIQEESSSSAPLSGNVTQTIQSSASSSSTESGYTDTSKGGSEGSLPGTQGLGASKKSDGSANTVGGAAAPAITGLVTVTAVVASTPQNSLNMTQVSQNIRDSYSAYATGTTEAHSLALQQQPPAVLPATSAHPISQSPQDPALPIGTLYYLQQITNMLASTFMPVLQLITAHSNPISLSSIITILVTLVLIPLVARVVRQGYASLLAASGYSNAARSDAAYALNTFLAQLRADGFDALHRMSAFFMPAQGLPIRLSSFAAFSAGCFGLSTAERVYVK